MVIIQIFSYYYLFINVGTIGKVCSRWWIEDREILKTVLYLHKTSIVIDSFMGFRTSERVTEFSA